MTDEDKNAEKTMVDYWLSLEWDPARSIYFRQAAKDSIKLQKPQIAPHKPRTAATFTRARIRAQCDVMRANAGLEPAQWPE